MGITKLIALKASVLLVAFGYLRKFGAKWLPLPLLHASLVSYMVSVASHPAVNLPLLLGKSSDGRFPLWSVIIFGPYLIFVRSFVLLRRLWLLEPVYVEISEGLFVGGWPSALEHLPPGDPAIIDCTCELPRRSSFLQHPYICIPTWDTRAPQPSQIESAVRWACRKRAQKKPIYIHCAFGHGRSVTVMCALLVELGLAVDWKHAEKIIREKRPTISINSLHHKSLEEWSKHRLQSKRDGVMDLRSIPTYSDPFKQ